MRDGGEDGEDGSLLISLAVSRVFPGSLQDTPTFDVSCDTSSLVLAFELILSVWIGNGTVTVGGFNGARGLKNAPRSLCRS